MHTPTTLDELKEQLLSILPNAEFEIDDFTGEVIIFSSLSSDDDGELEEMDELDFGEAADDEDENLYDDEETDTE